MPVLQLCDKDLKSDEGKQALHELRQACAKAIINIIEDTAKTGFKCELSTGRSSCFGIIMT